MPSLLTVQMLQWYQSRRCIGTFVISGAGGPFRYRCVLWRRHQGKCWLRREDG